MAKLEIPEGWAAQAYRFALDPTDGQLQRFAQFNGGRRFARNYLLAQIKANLSQREAEKSYGAEDLTPSLSWSRFSLRKHWNEAKNDVAPWWAENSKEVYSNGLADLSRALENWADSKNGKRKGPRMGFPGFEKKGKAARFTFTTGAIRVDDRRHIVLPGLGRIRTAENTRTLHRRLQNGTARLLKATVTRNGGRWYASFNCLAERRAVAPRAAQSIVGIDVGVKDLVVVARPDGTEVERVKAPSDLKHAQRRLRAAQRKASRRTEGSRGHRQATAEVRKLHTRVASIRVDRMHKLTSRLVREHDVIGVETLNVKGMSARGGSRKRGLNRSIANASLGRLLQQIDYKAAWYGATVVKADRWHPSSKTCSGCGSVKAKPALSERTYVCTECGLVIDRDHNAAVNLAKLAAQSCGVVTGGVVCKPSASAEAAALKPEPGGCLEAEMAA